MPRNDNLNAALEYLERGWSIIPLDPNSKKPMLEWREFQDRCPTDDEVTEWWTEWPYAVPAVITGRISKVYVVDVDSPEALVEAEKLGLTRSPVQTRTKRGRHFWYDHPADGVRRGPRVGAVGSSDPTFRWDMNPGLDWKGDGGYVALPHPAGNYAWDVQPGYTFEDMPVWQDLPGTRRSIGSPEDKMEDINLSGVALPSADAHLSEWARTEAAAIACGGLIPTGQSNGRNQRVARYTGECIKAGHWGQALEAKVREFMEVFFVEPLPDRELRATLASMMRAEKRNYPDRFDAAGNLITVAPPVPNLQTPTPPPPPPANPFIFMEDAAALVEEADKQGYLIHPIIPVGGRILQVYGYTGHGKSTIVKHLIGAAAAIDPSKGSSELGPFVVHKTPRVMYLNFEEGMGTIGRTLLQLKAAHGDTGDRLAMWAPFKTPGLRPHMGDQDFLKALTHWMQDFRPDILVVDTVRTAWSGLEENKAEAWAPVNDLIMKVRNAGVSVVLLHHGNKPSEIGLGREAGSTNQLSVIELQLRVTNVYEDENRAKVHNGIFSGRMNPVDYCLPENTLDVMEYWRQGVLGPDEFLPRCSEVRYLKNREPVPEQPAAYLVGFAVNRKTGARRLVATPSPPQAARMLMGQGMQTYEIAEILKTDLATVKGWLT